MKGDKIQLMKTLAIDFGKTNIGLAVSDETGMIATKLPGLKVSSNSAAGSKIAKITANEKVGQILVGIPQSGEIRETIREFCAVISKRTKLKVIEWNEDFTSKAAEQGTSKKFKKEKSHSEAARIILQEYLDFTLSFRKSI